MIAGEHLKRRRRISKQLRWTLLVDKSGRC